jgi:hypothetical protein
MTSAERLEAAQAYLASKGEAPQTWMSKETNRQMYAISFWVYKGKECLGKVMGTGDDLLVLIEQLQQKEKTAIEKGAVPALVAPTPAAKDEVGYTFCNNCMMSQPSSNIYCSGCSCRLC